MTRAALGLIVMLSAGAAIAGLGVPAAAQSQASPEQRAALVIGNSAYRAVPALPNAAGDARAVAAVLKRLGFAVTEGYDVTKEEMELRLRAFGQAAHAADLALVYYAGHGLQVADKNYLVPVDAKLENGEQDLRWEMVTLERVLDEAQEARRLQLVILDACRTNPLAARVARAMGANRAMAVGRGLAPVDGVGPNMLVAYATAAGQVAKDGADQHSPYTQALLEYLEKPGIEVSLLFRKVRDRVMQATRGEQQPFVYGSLGGDEFYLNPTAASAPPPGPGFDERRIEVEFWDTIKGSSKRLDFQDYLARYPEGAFASLARRRLEALQPAPSPTPAVEETYRKGEEAYGRQDYRNALRWLRQAADQGHPAAQNNLGMLYETGEGVRADPQQALQWFRKAAEQGNTTAQVNIGFMYERGFGVPRNLAQARYWYGKAADAGQPAALKALERLGPDTARNQPATAATDRE